MTIIERILKGMEKCKGVHHNYIEILLYPEDREELQILIGEPNYNVGNPTYVEDWRIRSDSLFKGGSCIRVTPMTSDAYPKSIFI